VGLALIALLLLMEWKGREGACPKDLSTQAYKFLVAPLPVWYENPSGVVIRPDNTKHKHRWSGSVDSAVVGSRDSWPV